MTPAFLIFAILATVLCGSALAVITARNTVHSVLFLILAFFNAAGLFLMLGAEFLAMMLVVVYVGAVAVLFLFVVMMLNVTVVKRREDWLKFLPLGLLVGGILAAELLLMGWGWQSLPETAIAAQSLDKFNGLTNTHALGQVLYTDYFLIFQLSGLILLIAMIGAITLCLRRRPGVRKQDIQSQIARNPKDVIGLVSNREKTTI